MFFNVLYNENERYVKKWGCLCLFCDIMKRKVFYCLLNEMNMISFYIMIRILSGLSLF